MYIVHVVLVHHAARAGSPCLDAGVPTLKDIQVYYYTYMVSSAPDLLVATIGDANNIVIQLLYVLPKHCFGAYFSFFVFY